MSTVDTVKTDPKPFRVSGNHYSNTTLSSATVLTAPTGATKLLLQVLTQNIRITLDGTTPTATIGFQIKAGDPAVIIPINVGTSITVIEETSGAVIQYQWGN